MPSFSESYRPPVRHALALQVPLFIWASLLLDGGIRARWFALAMAAHWLSVIFIVLRRPSSPTKCDLLFIRVGVVPIAVLIIFFAPLLGRSLW